MDHGPDIARRGEVLQTHKADGGKIAAVFPIHYPRALLRAFGVLPMEVWGPPGVEPVGGDAHLQAYTCSVVRCGLSFLLDGGLDAVDLIVVPHGCDSLQGLGSILFDFVSPGKPLLTICPPRNVGSGAVDYFVAELRVAYEWLAETLKQRPDEAVLREAVRREERADARFGELLLRRSELPLSNRQFYALVRSREYLPAERFCDLAEAALASASEGAQRDKLPVVLSGVIAEPAALLDLLDDAGAVVAADDLVNTGRRAYPPGDSDDPFRRMAESIHDAPADATQGASVASRIAHLEQLVASSKSRAVIFYNVKFCEPEAFYLPQLRARLRMRGIRSVVIEHDLAEPLADQLATRVEALLETVA